MRDILYVVPSAPAVADGDSYLLDRKMVDGLSRYAQLWPGRVRCIVRPGDAAGLPFASRYGPADLPFELKHIDARGIPEQRDLVDAAVVLCSGDTYLDFELVDASCAPVVFTIENTLATRLQIAKLHHGLSLKALKSAVWTVRAEARRRRAFRRAAGLQCNGRPAYDAYGGMTRNSLLFFDTRAGEAQQITEEQLAAKRGAVQRPGLLRIVFSGRLDSIKGVDHLVPIIAETRKHGIDVRLDVFGDGPLRKIMEARVAAERLESHVTLHGAVPFESKLVPALIAEADLFLCCHRQGDPSCTYLETLGCGVPILGYDNVAFRGVLALGNVGRAVPMDSIKAAAGAIADLAGNRPLIASMMGAAAQVARERSFEREFDARIQHLRGIAGV